MKFEKHYKQLSIILALRATFDRPGAFLMIGTPHHTFIKRYGTFKKRVKEVKALVNVCPCGEHPALSFTGLCLLCTGWVSK